MENDINDITMEDYQMSSYILSILNCRRIYLMSWGFESPVVIRKGLRFKVNGFLLKGSVQIEYNDGLDLFDLTFFNKDNSKRNTLEGIYVDQLVEVIDMEVEYVDNYTERVNHEYNITNNEKEII